MVGNCKTRSDFKRYNELPSQLSKLQLEAIHGLLLGDGFIPATKGRYHCFGFEQCEARLEYVEHVFNLFAPYTSKTKITTVVNDKTKWGKGIYSTHRFRSGSHPVFTEIRNSWYTDSRKILPSDLRLSWAKVAYWFADDGHKRKNGKEASFASESFTMEENLFLVELLKKDLGIRANICRHTGGTQVGIRILSADYFPFFEGIQTYLSSIKCLSYKIDTSTATVNTTPRYTEEVKTLSHKMSLDGIATKDIAKIIGCDPVTIRRWEKNYG